MIEKNIKSLFNISNIPSDTQLRDVIDPIPFESLRPAFDAILSSVQRGNELQKFITLGHYAIALDGTGYFSSSAVKCKHCLTKKIKIKKELKKEEVDDYDDESENDNRELQYHHQMLAASIIHPSISQVLPLFPAITKQLI